MHFGARNRHIHRRILSLPLLATFFLSVILSFGSAAPAPAREPGGQSRDIAALLRSSKPIRIAVVGDSIAGDLARGLYKILRRRDNLDVVKFTKAATGLMRDDVYDWERAIKGFVRKRRVDVIAVMIGGNDRQSIFVKRRRLEPGTEAWRAEYARRLHRFMNVLAATDAKVYWVGLPVVRSDKMSRGYRMLNGIQRAQARRHGFTYVDTWAAFADAKGRYTSFGRSLDGSKRRLRKKDGMHFTIAGELRLAHTVARAIARDVDEIGAAN